MRRPYNTPFAPYPGTSVAPPSDPPAWFDFSAHSGSKDVGIVNFSRGS